MSGKPSVPQLYVFTTLFLHLGVDFQCSFGTARLFQRKRVCELLGVSPVLEETGICSILKVSSLMHMLVHIKHLFTLGGGRFPHCLHYLDLLQSEDFRRELANTQCSTFIENQQLLHWHLYTKKRMQFQEKLCELFNLPEEFLNRG